MKSIAAIKLDASGATLPLQGGESLIAVHAELTAREKINAYVELTKPRITFLILLIALAGFCLGAPPREAFDYARLAHTLAGIA